MREDCLNLNIWTPAVNDGRKRPVLFWLHGGGMIMGSSHELKAYDGANLTRRGDVVVVSINHRLNGFGFLNLSEFGERYSSSSHVGMLDIIAALEWVRDNIAGFGGDPGNVTVFGWSGGEAKVNYLMAMPAAQGLFHKAVAQSPIPLITKPLTVEQSLRVTARTLETLGLDRSSIEKVFDVSAPDLVRATARGLRGGSGLDTAPVADGKILPANPFHPEAPAVSARVPLMLGNTMRESGPCLMCRDAMSAAELRKLVSDKYGDRAEGIIETFRAVYPEDEPFDLWSHINFFEHREAALLEAERKATLIAPVYLYLFAWRTPMFEGRPRAFHGSELAFVFDNVDRCGRMTGGTDDARALASRVSGAWISFARSGKPSHSGLPNWPAVTAESRPTMIFDVQCEAKVDHDHQARQALARA